MARRRNGAATTPRRTRILRNDRRFPHAPAPRLRPLRSLALGACSYPDGSPDYGSTAALGIGAAALVGLAAVAASSNNNHNDNGYYRRDYRRYGGYRQDRYAYRDRPYRRW